MRERSDGYEILRVGFQNIWGTDMNNGFAVAPELDAMDDIGTDVQGMAESNKPWNSRNKAMYQTQLDLSYNRARAIYLSVPADYNITYQPGGSLCIIAGNSAGRVITSGSNRMGGFSWYTVQGKRDEGILIPGTSKGNRRRTRRYKIPLGALLSPPPTHLKNR